MPSAPKSLGFDLAELSAHMTPAPASQSTAAPLGRPRTLPETPAALSVRLTPAQRTWLLQEAARRTLASGERHDVSRVVRALIDQARGAV